MFRGAVVSDRLLDLRKIAGKKPPFFLIGIENGGEGFHLFQRLHRGIGVGVEGKEIHMTAPFHHHAAGNRRIDPAGKES